MHEIHNILLLLLTLIHKKCYDIETDERQMNGQIGGL